MTGGTRPRGVAATRPGTLTAPIMESIPRRPTGPRKSVSTAVRLRGPTARSHSVTIGNEGAQRGGALRQTKAVAVAGMGTMPGSGTRPQRRVLHKSTESLRGGKVLPVTLRTISNTGGSTVISGLGHQQKRI